MKKLLLKSTAYSFVILVSLELLVRLFYLGRDTPSRFLDEHQVEKWVPNQQGFSVTGNRRQNFSEYHINNFGYNSYREFTPTLQKTELALVGDSFIQGFHQDYHHSIGKKIEHTIADIEVYEYGYAGYDFADQLHLIHSYKKEFDLIDHIILYLKFSDDLTRSEYSVISGRLELESPMNKMLRKSKLLVYAKSIGLLDPPQLLMHRIINLLKPTTPTGLASTKSLQKIKAEKEKKYLDNFKKLTQSYGYNKKRHILLLDSSITPPLFMKYLIQNGYQYIDFGTAFNTSDKATTLIYDRHWNDHGRTLIAKIISDYLQTQKKSIY